MPGRDDEHKAGGGRHGAGKDDEGHGRPGHKHEEGGGRPGREGHEKPGHDRPGHDKPGHDRPGHDKPGHDRPGHDKPGHDKPGHGKPGHAPPGGDDDDSDDDDKVEGADEQEFPGVGKAGRVAGRAWKRANNIDGRTKDLNEEQKKQIRAVKREARQEFRQAARRNKA